ncbi:MAG: helix-turn-helix transcriptional regulator [Candidatus Woesebacteria bacterium]|nr:helix-turn-helix transcriptional regulator [Candidatus Woesebacteria bacterium]
MNNKLRLYTFEDDLEKRLKNPKFKREWEKSEAGYLLADSLIRIRLSKKVSQRSLAKKLKTSQAAVSKVETMSGNPSFSFLNRIAEALNSKLILKFEPL